MSTQTKDGGPAFPETRWDDITRQEVQWTGLSARDYFAAKETLLDWDTEGAVMPVSQAAQLAGEPMPEGTWDTNPIECYKWEAKWRAALKYIRADAMIAAREGGAK